MGVRQYNLGKQHGLAGIRSMAHRNLRQYDSSSANESYHNGYRDGVTERYKTTKKISLDYTQPLNNRLFPSDD